MKTRWRWVKKYKGKYMVSNKGRVYSVPRWKLYSNGKLYRVKGTLLKLTDNGDGYYTVGLSDQPKRRLRTIGVHQLVAQAFVDKPETDEELEVNHKDGNKKNNRASNLEWVTSDQNTKHAMKLGLIVALKGSEKVEAKLNEHDVRRIMRLYRTGHYSQKKLGRMFDVGQSVISTIVNGKAWKHITLKITIRD